MHAVASARSETGWLESSVRAGAPGPAATASAGPHPDERWAVVAGGGEARAGCSLWWRRTPALAGRRSGLIGEYWACNAEAGRQLLEHACERLSALGCGTAVGPVDGSTWRRYRLLTERGHEPAFFLEPDNPDHWPGHFLACGFVPIAGYTSELHANLENLDARLEHVAPPLDGRGVRIRALDPRRLAEELRLIYAVSIASFTGSFLYAPLDEGEFLELYRPILPHVRPELVLIAEREEEGIGFLFALPDALQERRHKHIDTVIMKTLAVLPEWRGWGLGTLLLARCHAAARDLGYARAIHALMRDDNPSRRIGRRGATVLRRYALFGRDLGP